MAQSNLAQRRGDLALHDESERPEIGGDSLVAALATAREAETGARDLATEAEIVIRTDDKARLATAALRTEQAKLVEAAFVWRQLDQLIGDKEGQKFRRFAQGLTLDRLVAHANLKLEDLKPRYRLERGLGGDMLIVVVDQDMAGEVRGMHNLSGGERFLVSLALALGLSEMSSDRGTRIESLFIDEGFGALDSHSLGAAIAMLERLHATGRRVGVISHVEEVKDRIPVKIEVTPIVKGRSEINVVTG